jgi:hypothetical protein
VTRAAPIAALLLAAQVLTACGTAAIACDGDVQGTLTFQAAAVATPTTCNWFQTLIEAGRAGDQSFTATVSFLDAANAAVCLQRTLSQTKTGPRSGDTFTVSSTAPAAAGAVGTCPCAGAGPGGTGVDVEETFSATLVRGGDGRVTGYRDGSLVAHLTRSADDAAVACYATADAAGTSDECPGASAGCDVAYVLPPP